MNPLSGIYVKEISVWTTKYKTTLYLLEKYMSNVIIYLIREVMWLKTIFDKYNGIGKCFYYCSKWNYGIQKYIYRIILIILYV